MTLATLSESASSWPVVEYLRTRLLGVRRQVPGYGHSKGTLLIPEVLINITGGSGWGRNLQAIQVFLHA